jgi:murein L,D-transpeptidase YcbB/YkuD
MRPFVILVLCAGLMFSCRKVSRTAPHRIQPTRAVKARVSAWVPMIMPADSSHAAYAGLNWPKEVRSFYTSRRGQAYWLTPAADSAGLTGSWRDTLMRVQYLGLLPEDYHSAERASPGCDSIRQEALLTDAFLSLAHDLKHGRAVASAGKDPVDRHALDSITGGMELARYLSSQEPAFIGYHELKKALRSTINAALPGAGDAALQQKIRLAAVNLDRWRQLPVPPQTHYLLVNIPAYTLYLVDRDSIVLESRIIVGKPETPTPELSGSIDRITVNPYWYVPRKIAVEEFLPQLQTDTAFLTNNNFDVLDRKGNIISPDSIEWKAVTPHTFRVVLRQRPGRENSLGVFKFVFENPFAVYLHDTNAKKLFKKTMRGFSHGCIRVERAEELAHYLVTGSFHERSQKINRAVASGQTLTIRLRQPLVLYITYLTAAGKAGELIPYDDLYQCDSTGGQ